ncbi:putative transmembrane protein 62 [Paratrimastix pyriformis]|uniref:Transmembrane protein 62 n=1 Tax=Paratrimastix pyriformis TaxID=342808 RepID=A0ABQ8UW47_9EUKA|nr:putative transmembrane protein 62 [Paratrimastix pyriformis]
MGATNDSVFWFLQVTDIQARSTTNNTNLSDLESFLRMAQQSIRPDLILVTGDLVYGRNGPNQAEDPDAWQGYRDVLLRSGALDPEHPCEYILDVPGERDGFGMRFSPDTPETTPRTHRVLLEKPFGRYAFLGLDMYGPDPFWLETPVQLADHGEMSPQAAVEVQSFLQEGPYNGSIFYMHPTINSVSLGSNRFLNEKVLLSPNLTAVLDGHYHYAHMYRRTGKILELELDAWSSQRVFRLAAFDHDLFSFIDVRLAAFDHDLFSFIDVRYAKDQVAIMITNPKDARILSPREPLYRIAQSTHVRALVFPTPAPGAPPVRIARVWAVLNDTSFRRRRDMEGPGQINPDLMLEMSPAGVDEGTLPPYEGPVMWTLPWNASQWFPNPRGYGTILVIVGYQVGDNTTLRYAAADQPYTLDGTAVQLPGSWERFEMGINLDPFWISLLGCMCCFDFLVLLVAPKCLLLYVRRGGVRERALQVMTADSEGMVLAFCIRTKLALQKRLRKAPVSTFDGLGHFTLHVGWWRQFFWRQIGVGLDAYFCLADSWLWWYLFWLGLIIGGAPYIIGPFQGRIWGLAFVWGFFVNGQVHWGSTLPTGSVIIGLGFSSLLASFAYLLRCLTEYRARRLARQAAEEEKERQLMEAARPLATLAALARDGREIQMLVDQPSFIKEQPPLSPRFPDLPPPPSPRPRDSKLRPSLTARGAAARPATTPLPRWWAMTNIWRHTVGVASLVSFYAVLATQITLTCLELGFLAWLATPASWWLLTGPLGHWWIVRAIRREWSCNCLSKTGPARVTRPTKLAAPRGGGRGGGLTVSVPETPPTTASSSTAAAEEAQQQLTAGGTAAAVV